jgi:putative colanic acid biosynthesis UDP-glucose lipid carrier transferase
MLFWGQSYFGRLPVKYDIEYYQLTLLLNLTWIVISWIKNLYGQAYLTSFEEFSRKTMHVYAYFVLISMLYLYFYKKTEISRLFMGFEFVAIAGIFFINRLIYLLVFQYLMNNDSATRKVLIIGYNQTAKKLVNYLEKGSMNTEIVGYCDEDENIQELTNYPVVSRISNAMKYCSVHGNITEIYSTVSPEQNNYLYQLMREADERCIRFKIIPDLNYYIKLPVHIDYFKNLPVLSVRKEPLEDVVNGIKKRIFDLCVSGVVILFILSWLMPLIGFLIWLEDRGPIFFIQPRSGKNNKHFNCLKFRSMRVNGEANSKQATRNDDRITRIGKILRSTSLDEFPQFLNVFMGDMSIVGPRPHMLKHTDEYSKTIKQFMVRQFVKPGITGWAQINGYRGEIKKIDDIKKRVEYDLWYVENWSLWLDAKILFLTFYKILKGDENAF